MSDHINIKKTMLRIPEESFSKLDELRTLFEFDGSRNRFLTFLITEGIRAQANFLDDEKSREYAKKAASEIDQVLYEYEEEVQFKRELALEKGRKKSLKKRKKKRGLTVKERIAIRKEIIRYLKKNRDRPVSKRDIHRAVSFSKEKVEAILGHYNGTKWIIYKSQKKGQSHKVALIGTPAEKEVKRLLKEK